MMTFSRTRAFCRPSQNRNERKGVGARLNMCLRLCAGKRSRARLNISLSVCVLERGWGQFHNVPQSDLLPHFFKATPGVHRTGMFWP